MTTRIKFSKKIRFDIFKRDGFTCQYCGNTPPAIVLELDHIVALANGGPDTKENLITACFDCNRGKSTERLDVLPETVAERVEQMEEREAQVRAFQRVLAAKRRRESKQIAAIEGALLGDLNFQFTQKFQMSVRHFLDKLPFDTIQQFAWLASSKVPTDANRRTKYFCACCWNVIKGKNARS